MVNPTLERTEHPPLEQRGDVMHTRHDFVSLFIPTADDRHALLVACSREPRIACPPVGVNDRARFHRLSNEVQQTFGGNILDAFQSDAPDRSPFFSAATTTMDFFPISRPRLPSSGPPT